MSYLLFMDESGHDHKSLPYEVRGGICLRDNAVGAFTDDMKHLEINCFGDHLHNYGSEIKAVKLLRKDRFKWADYEGKIPSAERRKLCRQFLAATARGSSPTRRGFCAYGQASQAFVRLLFSSLKSFDAKVFGSMIPRGTGRRPITANPELVRKDITFLFERFYYFLDEKREMGMIVMDEKPDRTGRPAIHAKVGTILRRPRARPGARKPDHSNSLLCWIGHVLPGSSRRCGDPLHRPELSRTKDWYQR